MGQVAAEVHMGLVRFCLFNRKGKMTRGKSPMHRRGRASKSQLRL